MTDTTTATTTTDTTTAATTTAATATPAAPWHGITDPEAAKYVENKGWKGAGDVIKSYQGVEKFVGRDPSTLLSMPRGDDPVGLRAVFSKLGLPETADKYEIDVPKDGVKPDDGYVKWARDTFHKAGLLPGQVKELSTAHNAYVKGLMAQQEKDYQVSVGADKAALLAEWKGGHERMMNVAQSAAKSLGFSPEVVDAIERSVGYAGTMKMFAEIGKKLGEDNFVTGGAGKGGGFSDMLTPDEAKGEWNAMKLDTNTMAALRDPSHPGHKGAKEKQTRLFKVMYPDNAVNA